MTPDAYRAFYEEGHYRELVGWYRGEAFDWKAHDDDQWLYAVRLTTWLLKHGVLTEKPLAHVGADPKVFIDPIATMMWKRLAMTEEPVDSISDWEHNWTRGESYELIACCRTIDHLLEPVRFLEHAKSRLMPGGWLYVDILENGDGYKIDHPYVFSDQSVKHMLRAVGFTLLAADEGEVSRDHSGYLCQRPW